MIKLGENQGFVTYCWKDFTVLQLPSVRFLYQFSQLFLGILHLTDYYMTVFYKTNLNLKIPMCGRLCAWYLGTDIYIHNNNFGKQLLYLLHCLCTFFCISRILAYGSAVYLLSGCSLAVCLGFFITEITAVASLGGGAVGTLGKEVIPQRGDTLGGDKNG